MENPISVFRKKTFFRITFHAQQSDIRISTTTDPSLSFWIKSPLRILRVAVISDIFACLKCTFIAISIRDSRRHIKCSYFHFSQYCQLHFIKNTSSMRFRECESVFYTNPLNSHTNPTASHIISIDSHTNSSRPIIPTFCARFPH